MTFRTTIEDIAREFTLLIIAAFLLAGQGPNLVNHLYSASLSMMGSAANVALQVGHHTAISSNDLSTLGTGMHALTCTVEKGAKLVFKTSSYIAHAGSGLNPMPWVYSLILIFPYFLVVVVYFSLVVLSIFRIQMIAILSPFLMLGFGFPWGRNMLQSGLKALVGTFMVLFGGTAAVAVMLYAVSGLFPHGVPTLQEAENMASIYNEKFLMTLMMGWLGLAFMAEATGMTNSITGTSFTNSASAIISTGAVTIVAFAYNNPASKVAKNLMIAGAAGAGSTVLHNSAKGAGYAARGVAHLVKSMKK